MSSCITCLPEGPLLIYTTAALARVVETFPARIGTPRAGAYLCEACRSRQEVDMSTPPASRRPGIVLAAASLVTGPLLMSIGDLLHPDERMAPAEQVAILVDHASRWYTAHLLLFIGMMLFVPGLLALSALAMARRPASGRAARVLSLVGMA